MSKRKGTKEHASAVDQLIAEKGIETEATKGFDTLLETFVKEEKEELISLLKESAKNLRETVNQTLTEIHIDSVCDETCKAFNSKMFQMKNNVFYTNKRLVAIENLIKELETGDEDGSMPEATE